MAIIRVITRLKGRQTREEEVRYEDSGIIAGDTLVDFRRQTQVPEVNLFEDPKSAGKAALDRDAESDFRIVDIIGDAKSPKPIVVWSTRYADEVHLTLLHKGRPRSEYSLDKTAFEAMKLHDLRNTLVAAGQMASHERFVDQGVPFDPAGEKHVEAADFLSGAGILRSMEVMSRVDAEGFAALMQWRDQLPPIDSAGFRVNLEKPAASEYNINPGSAGGGQPSGTAMTIRELTLADQEALLTNCSLYPRPLELATCPALRFGERDVEFGPRSIITCKTVRIMAPQLAREDRVTFSYTKELHQWQNQLTNSNSLGINIPLVFGMKAVSESSQESATLRQGETVHLSKLLVLPKAEVLLEGVALTESYIEEVRRVVHSPSGLLDILSKYGVFVATDFLIGGKVSGRSSTSLTRACTRQELAQTFGMEVTGAFNARHILTTGQQQEQKVKAAMHEVYVQTIGGFGEAGASGPGQEGGVNWLATVATQPKTWKVIGYGSEGIRPILDYYPDNLQRDAKALLRGYFESQLVLQKSAVHGGSGGSNWDDPGAVQFRNRISKCEVMMDQNIDSVRFTYMGPSQARPIEGQWHGTSREKKYEFTLRQDDEVVAVEVGWNQTVDYLIFYTRSGDNQGKLFGRGRGAVHKHIFEEPRIRGFHGKSGHFLDALGVYSYDLRSDMPAPHRSVLLSLERYLYQS